MRFPPEADLPPAGATSLSHRPKDGYARGNFSCIEIIAILQAGVTRVCAISSGVVVSERVNTFRHDGARGWLSAFGDALRGIRSLLARQRHARVHAVAAILVVAAGARLNLSRGEWIAVALCIGLVFAAEALNSAIEELADAVHPDQHPGIGRAKDVAAGGVLLAAIAAAAVGLIIFLPRLF